MKEQKYVIFLIIFFSFFSCKKVAENNNNSDNVAVIIEIIMKKDNDLVLFYKDGSNEWFVDNKTVIVSVKGSDEMQEIKFNINLNTLPNDYRLDIGQNYFDGQDTIQIKKFVLKYYDDRFEINEAEFRKYFRGNEYISYDEKLHVYLINKNKNGLYDPFFETTMEFYPELLKLIN
jgi:hypothetical protein